MKNQDNAREFETAIVNLKNAMSALGFQYYEILTFFEYLRQIEAQKMALINAIDGGVEIWATLGMFMKSRKAVDDLYERKSLREKAGTVHMMMDTGRAYPIEKCHEAEPAVEKLATPSIIKDRTKKKLRKLLFQSFTSACFLKMDTIDTPRQIKYWRGVLDAHRVSLQLSGKHTYTKSIQQADLFLKVIAAEATPAKVLSNSNGR